MPPTALAPPPLPGPNLAGLPAADAAAREYRVARAGYRGVRASSHYRPGRKAWERLLKAEVALLNALLRGGGHYADAEGALVVRRGVVASVPAGSAREAV